MPAPRFSSTEYALLDSGHGQRLERAGPVVIVRPAPAAAWDPALPPADWQAAQARFVAADAGRGAWLQAECLPADWPVAFGPLRFSLRPSPAGQIGLFPEQRANWEWIAEQLAHTNRPLQVLNLFAYTGGSTLAAATAGAHVSVCHVDGARSAVRWARENATASGLTERPIRWIVEDVLTFVDREIRRGRRYDGVILDPPAFGRGAKGRTWRLVQDLPGLLARVREILTPAPLFVLLSCHDPALAPADLHAALRQEGLGPGQAIQTGILEIPTAGGGRSLPLGLFARWRGPGMSAS